MAGAPDVAVDAGVRDVAGARCAVPPKDGGAGGSDGVANGELHGAGGLRVGDGGVDDGVGEEVWWRGQGLRPD